MRWTFSIHSWSGLVDPGQDLILKGDLFSKNLCIQNRIQCMIWDLVTFYVNTEHQQNIEEFPCWLEKRKKWDFLIQRGAASTLMSTAQFTLQRLCWLLLYSLLFDYHSLMKEVLWSLGDSIARWIAFAKFFYFESRQHSASKSVPCGLDRRRRGEAGIYS